MVIEPPPNEDPDSITMLFVGCLVGAIVGTVAASIDYAIHNLISFNPRPIFSGAAVFGAIGFFKPELLSDIVECLIYVVFGAFSAVTDIEPEQDSSRSLLANIGLVTGVIAVLVVVEYIHF